MVSQIHSFQAGNIFKYFNDAKIKECGSVVQVHSPIRQYENSMQQVATACVKQERCLTECHITASDNSAS
jgi:hypothetical protein